MKKKLAIVCMLLVGCSKSDVETLGRIGQRVVQRTDAVLNSEPNKSLIHSLPLLQSPKATDLKDGEDGKQVPPRMNVNGAT